VALCGFFRVVTGMQVVAVRDVGMMGCLFTVPGFVMLKCLYMMASRLFMVVCRFVYDALQLPYS